MTVTGAYNVDVAGSTGTLSVQDDGKGNLSGTLQLGAEPASAIIGFWNEDAKQAFFQRVINPSKLELVQMYTGYLWATGGETHIAGTFEVLAGSGGRPQQFQYGWFGTAVIR